MALCLAWVAPAARAGSGTGVVLEYPAGRLSLAPAQIAAEADVSPTSYTLRAHPGDPGEQDVHFGLSVNRLIRSTGKQVGDFGFLTIPRADGSVAYLPTSYFADPPPFPEGPALVWVDSVSTHFFRPSLGSDDANAADNIATLSDEPLIMGLHGGALLDVVATASDQEIRSGQGVGFHASASGGLPGERLGFRWSFGDGGQADGTSVRHRFRGAGTFRVFVTVTGSRDSGGVSGTIPVVVGKSPDRGHPASTTRPRHHGDDSHVGGHPGGSGPRAGPAAADSAAHDQGTGSGSGSSGGLGSTGAGTGTGSGPAGTSARPGTAGTGGGPRPPEAALGPLQRVSGLLVADTLGPTASPALPAGGMPFGSSATPSDLEPAGRVYVPLTAILAALLLAFGAMREAEWPQVRSRPR
ncbi:MAG: PKD domain-containing protein [Solirubrobacterales bacterium]